MQSEDQLQAECFQWASNNYCLKHHKPRLRIFAVPNGSTRHKLEAMKLQATGLVAGVSDMIALFPNGKCVFFELKTLTGTQSDKQKDFEQSVIDLGFEYHLIRTFEQFKSAWLFYLQS